MRGGQSWRPARPLPPPPSPPPRRPPSSLRDFPSPQALQSRGPWASRRGSQGPGLQKHSLPPLRGNLTPSDRCPLNPLEPLDRLLPQSLFLPRGNPLQVTSALTRFLPHLTDAPTPPGGFDKVLGVPGPGASPDPLRLLASVGVKLSQGPACPPINNTEHLQGSI